MDARTILSALTVALACGVSRADTWYVSPTGSDAADGSSSAPFATITNALAHAADSGDTICLKAGTHGVMTCVEVEKGVTFRGEDGAIVCATNNVMGASDGKGSPKQSVFYLNHADAVLTNLTVTGLPATSGNLNYSGRGRGVYLNGKGSVLGCVITNNYTMENCGLGGAGVFLNGGGTVRGCLITHNRAYRGYGNGVYMTGGTVEDCTVQLNTGPNSSTAGGVWMSGGTLARCLVRKNEAQSLGSLSGSGVYMTGGTMAFCTVTGQTQGNKASSYGAVSVNGDATVTNTIAYGNASLDWVAKSGTAYVLKDNCTGDNLMSGTGNVCDDPLFVDAAALDYRVRPGAGAGKGILPVAVGATTPDCGAYLAARNDTVGSDTVTLAASVTGGAVANTTFSWTVAKQGGASQSKSGTGADYQTATFTCGEGLYDVTLTVTVPGVGSDACSRTGLFRVSPTDIYPAAGVTGSLSAAVDEAGNGTRIHLADGWYPYAGSIILNKNVSIASANGPSNTHIVATKASGVTTRPVVISHASAVLAGVDVSAYTEAGAAGAGRTYGGVSMSAGTVTNCWICNQIATSEGGGAVTMSGGILEDCLITNNLVANNFAAPGVNASGDAVVQRCRILHNRRRDTYCWGGGLYIGGTAKVLNSLIAWNVATYGAGIQVNSTSCRVINCTVVTNTATSSDAARDFGGIFVDPASKRSTVIYDCLEWCNKTGTLTTDPDDPGFLDAVRGDFHLALGSTSIDAASGTLDTLGPCDLALKDRFNPILSDDCIADKGCYEFFEDETVAVTVIEPEQVGEGTFAPLSYALSLHVSPRRAHWSSDECWWTFDGSEPSATHYDAVGAALTNVFKTAGSYSLRVAVKVDGVVYQSEARDFAVLGDHVYLARGSTPKKPYSTWETAAANLIDVLTCFKAGSTLTIGDGTFPLPGATIGVPAGATIRTANGPSKTTLDGSSQSALSFTLSSGTLSGFRLLNSKNNTAYTGALVMSGGLVSNVVFDASYSSGNVPGALMQSAGTVVDCVFTNCYVTAGAYGSAALVQGKEALVDRCRFYGSYASGTAAAGRGAITLMAGTVRNTLVTGTRHGGCVGIYVSKNTSGAGVVENCTVADNRSLTAADVSVGVYAADSAASVLNTIVARNFNMSDYAANAGGTAACFDHCATPDGYGGNAISGDPRFRDADRLNYRLAPDSPCLNAALFRAWMPGAKDLDGQPRVRLRADPKPDVGCYERGCMPLRILGK